MHKTIPVFDICCSVFQLTKLKQIQLTSDPADAASVRFLGADILKRRVALARCSLAVPKLAGSRCEPCVIPWDDTDNLCKKEKKSLQCVNSGCNII